MSIKGFWRAYVELDVAACEVQCFYGDSIQFVSTASYFFVLHDQRGETYLLVRRKGERLINVCVCVCVCVRACVLVYVRA